MLTNAAAPAILARTLSSAMLTIILLRFLTGWHVERNFMPTRLADPLKRGAFLRRRRCRRLQYEEAPVAGMTLSSINSKNHYKQKKVNSKSFP
jgi:hypothetical protein